MTMGRTDETAVAMVFAEGGASSHIVPASTCRVVRGDELIDRMQESWEGKEGILPASHPQPTTHNPPPGDQNLDLGMGQVD
jgi:hypothetical protein